MRNFKAAIFFVAPAIWLFLAQSAFGEEVQACQQFAWSVKREIEAFSGLNLATVRSGTALGSLPEKGTGLKLEPLAGFAFAATPQRKPKVDNSFAGILTFEAPARAGLYQITLSEEAWIDIVQGGLLLPSKAFSGKRGCPGVKKSVRFELQASPFTLQLSDVSRDTIKIAILPAE